MLLGRFQSSVLMNKVCTQYRLLSNCSENDEACMYKLIFEHALYIHCTNTVRTLYERCTNKVQCMYKMDFVHTPYVLFTFDTVQYELVCTDLY